MRIGVSGYYGYGNFGDEIFLIVWKRLFADHQVYPLQYRDDPSDCDAIIIGGGDILIPYLKPAYWDERYADRPCYVYGIGVPIGLSDVVNNDALSVYKSILSRCRFIAFRSPLSAQWAVEHGLCPNVQPVIVEDIAFAFESPVPVRPMHRTVGVSIRPNPLFDYTGLIHLLAHIINRGFSVLMIPLQPLHDAMWRDRTIHHETIEQVRALIPSSLSKKIDIVPPVLDEDHLWSVIGSCSYYLGQRMHGLLAALRQGVPAMGFSDSYKFRYLYEEFDENASGIKVSPFLFHASHGEAWGAAFDAMVKTAEENPGWRKALRDRGDFLAVKAKAELQAFREIVLCGK